MCAYASIRAQASSMILHPKKHITTVNVSADSAAAVAATTAAEIATSAAVCSPDCDDGLRVNMNRDLIVRTVVGCSHSLAPARALSWR